MRLQRRCARMALSTAALSLGEREVLVGRHPIAQLSGDRLEVARASKLLGAEAFGHLACELRDVTLLGCPDEDSLRAEPPQLGCNRSAAFRIPLNPRHVPTLFALRPGSVRAPEPCEPGGELRGVGAAQASRHQPALGPRRRALHDAARRPLPARRRLAAADARQTRPALTPPGLRPTGVARRPGQSSRLAAMAGWCPARDTMAGRAQHRL
jgi:hypothetical protein